MKSTREIINLRVLSVEEGKEIGFVHELLLNPQNGSIDFLLVKDGEWYYGLKALPFSAVQGIGEYALTVASSGDLKGLAETPDAVALLESNPRLIGLRVLSRKGRLLGRVREYYVDENSGKVRGCLLVPEGRDEAAGIIEDKYICTFGRELLVVEDDADKNLMTEFPGGEMPASQLEEKETAAPGAEPAGRAPETGEEVEEDSAEAEDSLKLFRERQRQYLIGKKLGITITSDDGEVIAEEGAVITGELIDRVTEAGKYILLTMNVRE